jgi:hypothetical protein
MSAEIVPATCCCDEMIKRVEGAKYPYGGMSLTWNCQIHGAVSADNRQLDTRYIQVPQSRKPHQRRIAGAVAVMNGHVHGCLGLDYSTVHGGCAMGIHCDCHCHSGR